MVRDARADSCEYSGLGLEQGAQQAHEHSFKHFVMRSLKHHGVRHASSWRLATPARCAYCVIVHACGHTACAGTVQHTVHGVAVKFDLRPDVFHLVVCPLACTEATLLFGRGMRAGIDRREQKKKAATFEAEMLRKVRGTGWWHWC